MNSQDKSQNPATAPEEAPQERGSVAAILADPTKAPRKGRRMALYRLPPETYQAFLQYLRLGAFDHVAAAALGITPETLKRWTKRGEKESSGIYRSFYLDVLEARGHARLMAELQVKRDDPKFWLTRGPGKTKPGLPGWTEEAAIRLNGEVEHRTTEQIAPLPNLAEALEILQELGLLTLSEATKQLFRQLPSPSEDGNGEGVIIDVPSNPNPNPLDQGE